MQRELILTKLQENPKLTILGLSKIFKVSYGKLQ